MANLLTLKILNFEQGVYSGQVAELNLRAIDGEVKILPGHAPYINAIKPGSQIAFVDENGVNRALDATEGFVKVEKGGTVYLFVQSKVCL